MTLRDRILSASDLTTREMEIPEWDVTVWIRSLTLRARQHVQLLQTKLELAWEKGQAEQASSASADLRNYVLTQAVVDEEGQHVFKAGDAQALLEKNGVIVERIFQTALRHSLLTKDSLVGAEKNSEATPSAS